MNKIFFLFCIFFLTSCGNKKDVLLPQSNVSVVTEVLDNSPIYMFFHVEDNDTVVDVNRKNSIISTNWLVNIDKRLPLKMVIPEVIKLQEKKRKDKAHKNDKAENYYSYADSIRKNIAFIPFTNVYYRLEKPKNEQVIYFNVNNTILINGNCITKEQFIEKLHSFSFLELNKINLAFDRKIKYGNYIQYKVLLHNFLSTNENSTEYIF